MSVKVFCGQAANLGYNVDPPNTFHIGLDYTIFTNDPIPAAHGGSLSVDIPVGSTPYYVYAVIFQLLVDSCVAQQLEVPTKNDVFGYIPTPFSVLLPDLPSFT